MKKTLVVLLSALLAMSLTACGGSDNPQNTSSPSSTTSQISAPTENSEPESPENSEEVSEDSQTISTDESESEIPVTSNEESSVPITEGVGPLFKKYIDLAQSGTCYIDMTMSLTVEDETTDVPMVMAIDGSKVYIESELLGSVGNSVCVMSDGIDAYMIDHTNKVAYRQEDSSSVSTRIDETFGDNYTLLDTGTTDYNGISCIFEEYDADGISQMMYFDTDGCLIAFTASQDNMEYVYTFNEFTDEIPDELFEIPEDYTITDYDPTGEILNEFISNQ